MDWAPLPKLTVKISSSDNSPLDYVHRPLLPPRRDGRGGVPLKAAELVPMQSMVRAHYETVGTILVGVIKCAVPRIERSRIEERML